MQHSIHLLAVGWGKTKCYTPKHKQLPSPLKSSIRHSLKLIFSPLPKVEGRISKWAHYCRIYKNSSTIRTYSLIYLLTYLLFYKGNINVRHNSSTKIDKPLYSCDSRAFASVFGIGGIFRNKRKPTAYRRVLRCNPIWGKHRRHLLHYLRRANVACNGLFGKINREKAPDVLQHLDFLPRLFVVHFSPEFAGSYRCKNCSRYRQRLHFTALPSRFIRSFSTWTTWSCDEFVRSCRDVFTACRPVYGRVFDG